MVVGSNVETALPQMTGGPIRRASLAQGDGAGLAPLGANCTKGSCRRRQLRGLFQIIYKAKNRLNYCFKRLTNNLKSIIIDYKQQGFPEGG